VTKVGFTHHSFAETDQLLGCCRLSRPRKMAGEDKAIGRVPLPPMAPAYARRVLASKKGHTKSRRGCVNCKRRKIKCQENLPECQNCHRLGLVCEYLLPSITRAPAQPAPSKALSTIPAILFDLNDMRFFQHFLLSAYPVLPLGGDEIWKNVARMSPEVRIGSYCSRSCTYKL
jgi:hypothetical protein